jgi:hypothetical protein
MGTAAINGELWGARADDWSQVQERQVVPLYHAVFDATRVGPGRVLLDAGCGAGMLPQPSTVPGMSLAVFDIDGVVADVRHRLHHIEGRPKQWSAFFGAAGDDTPLAAGLALVSDLADQHEILWVTGRPDWLRSTTREWLEAHGLPATELHMRANGDRRPARRYKLAVLRRLSSRTISAFVDDDPEVVEAATGAGFPALLADWVPPSVALRDAQERLGLS